MPSHVETLKQRIKELERENELLKENADFRPVFDNAPLGIFRTSVEGKFIRVNQTLCDILGYDNPGQLVDEIENIRDQIYTSVHDRDRIIERLKKADSHYKFEMDFKRKNGDLFRGLISAKLIRDEAGKPRYIEGTAEDISGYVKAEIEKKQSENLYKTLVNSISDTIVISDLSGKIEYASHSAAKIAGAGESVVGKNFMDWLDKQNQHKVKENIYKVLNNIPYRFEEYELMSADGTKFHAEIRTTILRDETGKPLKLILLIQDISFRKKTEEVLRETQNLYRTIIELSPEGILITYKGEILFLNAAMARILDTDNQWNVVGRQFRQVVRKKYLKDVNAILRIAEKGQPANRQLDIQIESLAGKVKDVTILASPIMYDSRSCVFLFISDITERVDAENRLRREMQLMDAFWQHVPDAITFKNKKGEYFRANDEFLKWIGEKNSRHVLGKTDREIFGYKHFLKSRAEEKKIFEKEELIINEVREEAWPRNNHKWVMLTKMPLRDVDQKVVGVFSITRDITGEKKSEIEIREREEWFRYIFDNSPVGKIITDYRFRVKTINRSAQDLLGYPVDKVLGMKVFNFFDKKDSAYLRQKFKISLKNRGETFQAESMLKTMDLDRNVIVQGIKISDKSKQQGEYLIHLIDIHSRKLAEDELLVRNTELNNFVYKVSHDLKAPLTSIKGLVNLMKLETDPAVFNQYIQMISSRVDRLDNFIRDVLSHSKNLNVEVKIEPVNLAELIEECIFQSSYTPHFKKIRNEVVVKGGPFYSDPHRLHEILRNLIGNAFQYSRNHHTDPWIKIVARITRKYCKLTVEDNGMGIKKKYQPRIFDMFYRANERVEGSGIGLYIVKQSVEKLNGQISFTSTVNKGTCFDLIIPNHLAKVQLQSRR